MFPGLLNRNIVTFNFFWGGSCTASITCVAVFRKHETTKNKNTALNYMRLTWWWVVNLKPSISLRGLAAVRIYTSNAHALNCAV